MNFTVHLTENCNMACSYCLREKTPRDMSLETLYKTIDLAYSKGNKAGFCFFGGEPLLKKNLIYEALDYCEKKTADTGIPFACKMTTNGTLIDEEFLARAKAVKMKIGLSFDGKGQDISRRFPDGSSSADILEKKAKLILSYLPNTMAMLTLDPKACGVLCESVKYLLSLGFTEVSTVMAYGKNVTMKIKIIRGKLISAITTDALNSSFNVTLYLASNGNIQYALAHTTKVSSPIDAFRINGISVALPYKTLYQSNARISATTKTINHAAVT